MRYLVLGAVPPKLLGTVVSGQCGARLDFGRRFGGWVFADSHTALSAPSRAGAGVGCGASANEQGNVEIGQGAVTEHVDNDFATLQIERGKRQDFCRIDIDGTDFDFGRQLAMHRIQPRAILGERKGMHNGRFK